MRWNNIAAHGWLTIRQRKTERAVSIPISKRLESGLGHFQAGWNHPATGKMRWNQELERLK